MQYSVFMTLCHRLASDSMVQDVQGQLQESNRLVTQLQDELQIIRSEYDHLVKKVSIIISVLTYHTSTAGL